ncbi:Gfo/Idh/MocA family oxidoreductase [Oceanobacillus caeni]|uniref:Gfo/Idh/MocA family protein n=1 Tax=Oceanobacillus caeni TaxID=405946 RepID=UPI001C21D695|nr:Gfo/Idh/MocA family oxidoreductase [Oceanobacillus caeni]MBU8791156.1 Gfo/Idh/MocA family oxidoreductase [Oceanobacillus caeni]
MEKVRVIQIGVGGFGQSWLEILDTFEELELVGVVDVVEDNLEIAKTKLNNEKIAFYQDHLQAFKEVSADAVVIITPPQTHKSLALDALEAGLYVFMEKPITQNFEEAIKLFHESQKYEKYIMISQNYRWRPEIEAVRQCVQSGEIGIVEYGEWNFRRATRFGGWRDKYSEILIEDMSIHHFDMLRYILGKEAKTIYAKSLRPSWSWFDGNAVASATISFEDDILINYFGSWVSRGKETSWNGEVKLVGSKGTIELIDDLPILTLEDGTTRQLPLVQLPYEDRVFSIYEMVRAIKENRKPITHIGDNIKSFAIVGGALKSIQQGKEVPITIQLQSIQN